VKIIFALECMGVVVSTLNLDSGVVELVSAAAKVGNCIE
jgi:hypothetical protein